jgi:hypothetical protein
MSLAAESSDAAGSWDVFLAHPALYIDPERLAACFDGELSADLCARLKASAHVEERLSRLIHSHHKLATDIALEAVDDIDRIVALAPAEQLADCARRAAAIYWADSIAHAILAPDVEAIHSALGEAMCTFALGHRNLSGPAQKLAPHAQLGTRIMEDGWRCLGAWCHAQADGVGIRVRLKLPAHPALDGLAEQPFDRLGPTIVREAAGWRPT